MKTIGLLGGMSWESTVHYYTVINEYVKEKLGGLHSAKVLMYSVDFAPIAKMQEEDNWQAAGEILADAAEGLEKAGADCIVICANTMHKVTKQIEARISVPVLHIADAAADALLRDGIRRTGLLGTKYTLTQDFIIKKLQERGLEVILPEGEDIDTVNDIIYGELCLGVINDASREKYCRIIEKMKDAGAEGVILGCTEIGMLVEQKDACLPVYDTTLLHARMAAAFALEEEK